MIMVIVIMITTTTEQEEKRDKGKLRDDINEIHTHDKMVPTERRSGIEREGKLNKGVR